jgi:hypothetical protein
VTLCSSCAAPAGKRILSKLIWLCISCFISSFRFSQVNFFTTAALYVAGITAHSDGSAIWICWAFWDCSQSPDFCSVCLFGVLSFWAASDLFGFCNSAGLHRCLLQMRISSILLVSRQVPDGSITGLLWFSVSSYIVIFICAGDQCHCTIAIRLW